MSDTDTVTVGLLTHNKAKGTFRIKDVRLSYPHLFKPWAQNEGDTKRFSARFLLDKKKHKKEIDYLEKHFLQLQKDVFKKRIPADKLCLRDGDLTGKPEDEGMMYLQASEKTRPLVVNKDKSLLTEDDDIVYAGCRVHAQVKFWTQNNEYGKRINANLLGVQFYQDGEHFGAERPDVGEDFDDESDDDSGSSDSDDGDDDGF